MSTLQKMEREGFGRTGDRRRAVGRMAIIEVAVRRHPPVCDDSMICSLKVRTENILLENGRGNAGKFFKGVVEGGPGTEAYLVRNLVDRVL